MIMMICFISICTLRLIFFILGCPCCAGVVTIGIREFGVGITRCCTIVVVAVGIIRCI